VGHCARDELLTAGLARQVGTHEGRITAGGGDGVNDRVPAALVTSGDDHPCPF